MVSPPATGSNPRPLSYADRAKKAQNLKPQNATQPQQRVSPQNPSPSSSSIPAPTTPTSAPMTTTVAPTLAPPKSSLPSAIVTDAPGTSGAPPAQMTSPPTSPIPTSANPAKGVNGDMNHAEVSSALSVQPQPRLAPPPTVNYWDKRKEQMAAQARARTTQVAAPEKQPQVQIDKDQLASSSFPLPQAAEPTASASASVFVGSNASTAPQSVRNHQAPPAISLASGANGHASLPPPISPSIDDAFTVRPQLAPPPESVKLPSAIDDPTSWPKPGSSTAASTEGGSRRSESREKETGEQADGEGSQNQPTPRKSEKPKWVAIPPEELQAAADAHRAHHPHGRNRQNHSRHPGSTTASGSASGSASGAGSHNQSRAHSAAGMRHSLSHVSSAVHSQVQSRTGSVHSSPRVPPRGMKSSPHEGSVTGASGYSMHTSSANRSMRSSRAGSPLQAAPSLLPPEFVPNLVGPVGPTYQGAGVPPAGPVPRVALPEQLQADASNGTTYYQPIPPPLSAHPSSYHSSRGPASPVTSTYQLPYPGPYGPPQGAMPPSIPPHPGYPGTPPYPMYNPYGYPYGQPYGYWPQNVPPSAVSPPPSSITSDTGLPPPTTITRPPAPAESDAVSRYREAGSAPSSSAQVPLGETEKVERGRRARELSFGSIGVPGASKSPSPQPPATHPDINEITKAVTTPVEKDGEKSFTTFSIGVAPGEVGPVRIRSRTRTHSKGHKAGEASIASTIVPEQPEEAADTGAEVVGDQTVVVEEITEKIKVIDLTAGGSDAKWEFGSTRQSEEPTRVDATFAAPIPPNALGMTSDVQPAPTAPVPFVLPPTLGQPSTEFARPAQVSPVDQAYVVPAIPEGAPISPTPAYIPQPAPLSDPGVGDEWEVRDYGYGFGRPGAPSYNMRDDRGGGRREFMPERELHGRPRRGSYSGYVYERGGHERGGFSGRRGRANGFGRGLHGRSFSRGGYQGRQPPFAVAQPLPPPSEPYYGPPHASMATYIPQGYDPYVYPQLLPPPPQAAPSGPPVPKPLSLISFPLDETRYYLLGQLEYYLSTQNMAQDFYLRQQMDSRGWIPISTIASFNRVRKLTTEFHVVRDVLTLSSIVEVRDGWVRMRQWEQFVLPNAPPSSVEAGASPPADSHASGTIPSGGDSGSAGSSHEGEGEDEEEEDVVFVMGKDAQPSWTPA
ncbi:hypothetical protein CERSUDRAFT_116981 [Gelatoporia subvermispora B]|uniref:HTH La-type RNA-binding domain-containing protein n=1 Tax=Ceriporiopsis subvermispora (strain B) TaxID=914234 RepID=M2R8N6_CERS8|nr:hypothetical protein CERSUDRAFT_116981 [Gelatoporia subvermispora B]